MRSPAWLAGDLLFTGFSAVDLALTPTYIGSDVQRPRLYDMDRFPPR